MSKLRLTAGNGLSKIPPLVNTKTKPPTSKSSIFPVLRALPPSGPVCRTKSFGYTVTLPNSVRIVILDYECQCHKANLKIGKNVLQNLKVKQIHLNLKKCIFDYFISPTGLNSGMKF